MPEACMWPEKHRTGAYVGFREILRKSFEIQALKNFGFAEWVRVWSTNI